MRLYDLVVSKHKHPLARKFSGNRSQERLSLETGTSCFKSAPMSRLGSMKQLELQNRVGPMNPPVKAYEVHEADTILLGCALNLRSRCSYPGVFSSCI